MKVGALGSYWVGDEMVSSEAVVVKLGATLPAPSSAPSPFSTYCAAPLAHNVLHCSAQTTLYRGNYIQKHVYD